MLSLVLLALGQMRSGRETSAGLLLGLAVVAKPYAVIFLPYLALRRRADSFFTLCAVLLLVLFLPSLLYGLDGNLRLLLGWVRTTFGTTIPNLTSQDSVSILGMYSKWLGIGTGAFALSLVTIVVLVTVFVAVFYKRADRIFPEYLEISLLLTLIPLSLTLRLGLHLAVFDTYHYVSCQQLPRSHTGIESRHGNRALCYRLQSL